ncbi:MAG: hypothetical protein K0U45_02145 [Alphaproteobacteria bacterium]|nr:hypothetical protein [Alphaproteobacteria bacterium]
MSIKTPIFSITKPIILGLVLFMQALPYASKLSVAKQAAWDIEPLPEHLVTDEIKLLYYYIFLKKYQILNILTEAEIATIIDELKQFDKTI